MSESFAIKKWFDRMIDSQSGEEGKHFVSESFAIKKWFERVIDRQREWRGGETFCVRIACN